MKFAKPSVFHFSRIILLVGATFMLHAPIVQAAGPRVASPGPGMFYHGVYPGGKSGEEDDLTLVDLQSYEKTVGAKAAWVYFSDNWYVDRKFPLGTATWIRDAGSLPFIRLMLRSKDHKIGHGEKVFTLQNIIDGKYDTDLTAWGEAAKKFGTPLMVEYGTEVNADWFGWNGRFHGGGKHEMVNGKSVPIGPARFVLAYRHIVETIRHTGADNITWVFHLDVTDSPEHAWNVFENYYPGNDIVDWIAVSCYGALTPKDPEEEKVSFREKFDPVYPRIEKLAPDKPLMIAEFGFTAGFPYGKPAPWAKAALHDILSGRWPAVRAFSWWNERWENGGGHKHDTTMRVQDIPELRTVFVETLRENKSKILDRVKILQTP
ncbi:MAG: beta-mannanase [Chthoniobacterales bacterium]